MEYYEFRAMNTDILMAAEGDKPRVMRGFQAASDWVQAMEKRLTRFAEDSELAQLNRSGGTWFDASRELFEIVQRAQGYYDETEHLFDPTVLDVLEEIGYDTSFERIGITRPISSLMSGGTRQTQQLTTIPRHPFLLDHRTVRRANGTFSDVLFDEAEHAILLPPGMRLDLGGIAKGWIAERAAEQLASYAEACAVNAGGDMFMVGRPTEEGAWRIALEDPRAPAQTLGVLRVNPGAVATSSIMRRRWEQDGTVRHHLIDPRRRAPADTDWLSVTVVAPHADTAEVYAKALLIAGSRGTPSLAARRPDIAFIAVDHEGGLWGSDAAKELLEHGVDVVK